MPFVNKQQEKASVIQSELPSPLGDAHFQTRMCSTLHERKILDPIILRVAIDVMDNLVVSQLPTEDLCHKIAMLKVALAVNHNGSVTWLWPLLPTCIGASLTAKNATREPNELCPTKFADFICTERPAWNEIVFIMGAGALLRAVFLGTRFNALENAPAPRTGSYLFSPSGRGAGIATICPHFAAELGKADLAASFAGICDHFGDIMEDGVAL